MLKKTKLFAALLFASASAGCVSNLTPDVSMATEDSFGSAVSVEECFKIAENHIKRRVIDPTSTLFNHIGCEKGYFYDLVPLGLAKSKAIYGYVWAGEVNSKNRLGGYVGNQWMKLLVKNGQVKVSVDNGMSWELYKNLDRNFSRVR